MKKILKWLAGILILGLLAVVSYWFLSQPSPITEFPTLLPPPTNTPFVQTVEAPAENTEKSEFQKQLEDLGITESITKVQLCPESMVELTTDYKADEPLIFSDFSNVRFYLDTGLNISTSEADYLVTFYFKPEWKLEHYGVLVGKYIPSQPENTVVNFAEASFVQVNHDVILLWIDDADYVILFGIFGENLMVGVTEINADQAQVECNNYEPKTRIPSIDIQVDISSEELYQYLLKKYMP